MQKSVLFLVPSFFFHQVITFNLNSGQIGEINLLVILLIDVLSGFTLIYAVFACLSCCTFWTILK